MPLKKSELEKLAWSWIESVGPDEIQREHLETAYRIGLKNCKNCKRNCSNNPCCLTGLGEEKYLKSQPAEVASLESSLSELRDPTQYVGLKNLGATCYVNSLIQVWFHNEDMRRIIYNWSMSDDPEESKAHPHQPCTVIGHLQYIFAMMQFGNKRLLDPTNLAIALSLDTDTQQDAQEFSKLLLAHIENKLQNVELKNRLRQLTQGTYIYVNRCSTCSTEYPTLTTFYELDLQLAATLKEAIENYLSEEELVGVNKYHCQRCNEKQNAKRFIRLDSLPDTLNFQLLRFVFHRESGQKKKLSSFIQFPEELDMSEYLNSPAGSHLYSLVAVLSHKGPSAHSGHYIVNICNSSGDWYQFSDDKVEKMQNKRIEDNNDNGKQKRSRVPKGFLSSNTAYMLVYKKTTPSKKPADNSKRKETSDSDSSDAIYTSLKKQKLRKSRKKMKNLENHVENHTIDEEKSPQPLSENFHENFTVKSLETNVKFEIFDKNSKNIENFDKKSESSEEKSENLERVEKMEEDEENVENLEEMEENFEKIGEKSPKIEEKAEYSGKCSENFRKFDEKCEKLVKLEEKPGKYGENLENFGKFEEKLRKNYDKSYEKLNGDAHRAMSCAQRDIYEAHEFQKWEVSETLRELVKNENVSHELSLLAIQQEKQKKIEEQNAKRQDVIDFFKKITNYGGNFENYVWIPTNWITKWLNDHSGAGEGLGEVDTNILLCTHGRMDPGKVHKAKAVPSEAAEMLLKKVKVKEKLDESSLCDLCVRKRCKTMRFKIGQEKDHKDVLEIIKVTKDLSEDSYIIGAESLRQWRKLAMDRVEDEVNQDHEMEMEPKTSSDNHREEVEDEAEPITFNDDLLCEHKNIRTPDASRKIVPGAAWRILKKYFPKAAEYPADTQPCHICEERIENAQKAKADDKIKGKHQKDELSELYHGKNRNEVIKEKNRGVVFYVVEKGFIDAWKGFIRTGRNAPTDINNSNLLCPDHKGFLGVPSTCNDFYTVVTEDEWRKLNEFYSSDEAIRIQNVGTDEIDLKTQPDQCQECMQAKEAQERLDSLNYEKATIYIKCSDDAEESESAAKSSRSSRTRRKTKGLHELKVSSQMTLKDLKVMIMAFCGAGPFDQHLTLEDQELTDSDQSLSSLGIYPNSTLKLKVDTPPDNEADLESDSPSREASSPEKGFKGTELVPS